MLDVAFGNSANCLQKEDEEKENSKEKFSLLKAFGRETLSTNDAPCGNRPCESKRLQSCIEGNNPFEYSSSENENSAAEDENERVSEERKVMDDSSSLTLNQHDDSFFFSIDDSRFCDTKQFFRKQSVPWETFQNMRSELKQIVRMKIRKNLRKNASWNRKRRL